MPEEIDKLRTVDQTSLFEAENPHYSSESSRDTSTGMSRREFPIAIAMFAGWLRNLTNPTSLLATDDTLASSEKEKTPLQKEIEKLLLNRKSLEDLLQEFGNTQKESRYDGLSEELRELLLQKEKDHPWRETWEELSRPVRYGNEHSPNFLQAVGLPPIMIKLFERYTDRKAREEFLRTMMEALPADEQKKIAREHVRTYLNNDSFLVRSALPYLLGDDEFLITEVLLKLDPAIPANIQTVLPALFQATKDTNLLLGARINPGLKRELELLQEKSSLPIQAPLRSSASPFFLNGSMVEKVEERSREAKKLLLEIAANPNGDFETSPEFEDVLWEIFDPNLGPNKVFNLVNRIIYLRDPSLVQKYKEQLPDPSSHFSPMVALSLYFNINPGVIVEYRQKEGEEKIKSINNQIREAFTDDGGMRIFDRIKSTGTRFLERLLNGCDATSDVELLKGLILAETKEFSYGLGLMTLHRLIDNRLLHSDEDNEQLKSAKEQLEKKEITQEEYDRRESDLRNIAIIKTMEDRAGSEFFLELLQKTSLTGNAPLYGTTLKFLGSYIELHESPETGLMYPEIHKEVFRVLDSLSKEELRMIAEKKSSYIGMHAGKYRHHGNKRFNYPQFAVNFAKEKLEGKNAN